MTNAQFGIFETAIGRCAILWRADAVTGVVLPAADDDALRAAIRRRPGAGPAAASEATGGQADFVTRAIAKISLLCEGAPSTFDDVPLDRSAIEPFANRVYDELLKTPFGATTTYGAIAGALGDKALSRAVGAALGANPFPIIIPCHRVTGANGVVGGFSAPGGARTKMRLLEIEGAFAAEKLPLFGG